MTLEFDSYTKCLLHMNGEDDGTVFTDEVGKTWVSHGAVTSIDYKKFGDTSLYTGGGGYIEASGLTDIALGSGNFTADCWVYPLSLDQHSVFQFNCTSGNNQLNLYYIGTGELCTWDNWTGQILTSGLFVTTGSWQHLAWARWSGKLEFFLDGTLGNTYDNYISQHDHGNENDIIIGHGWGGNNVNGYIDEVRMSIGIARWIKDFIPPTHEYIPLGLASKATRGRTRYTGNVDPRIAGYTL